MHSQLVRPAGARREGLYLLGVCGVILLAWAAMVAQRHVVPVKTELAPWQITAFGNLNPAEQGLFGDLWATAIEIDALHKDNAGVWPSVEDLSDLAMPPFPQDAMWEGRGRHAWTANRAEYAGGHAVVYLGRTASTKDARTFALVLAHRHPPVPPSKETRDPPREKAEGAAAGPADAFFTVWIHPTGDTPFPPIAKLADLAAAGWKEIVPVRGADAPKGDKK
ncbi:MAG: hypothetical protein HQL40_10465 [Alphaproteobacteria bacterium]|nr:hypothetical protein [Alphaproteobacteria bacterium]